MAVFDLTRPEHPWAFQPILGLIATLVYAFFLTFRNFCAANKSDISSLRTRQIQNGSGKHNVGMFVN